MHDEYFDDTTFFDGDDEPVPPSSYPRGWEPIRTFAAGDGGARLTLARDDAGDDLFGDELDDPELAGAEVIEYVLGDEDDEGDGDLTTVRRD